MAEKTVSIRGFVYPALLFLGAGAVAVHFAEGKQVGQILRHSAWGWLALAAFGQLLLLLNQSALYGAAYRLAGLPEKMGRLFLLVLAASFTAVAVPGGTLSGAGLMVYDAARRGRETARAVLANLIFFLLDYLAFLIVLALAWATCTSKALFLAFGGHPAPGRLIAGYAAGVLLMIVSLTPSGVGIMEGAMTAAYVSVGIPLGEAALL